MVQQVPREAFQGVDDIEPGMQFQAQTPQGAMTVTVTAADETTVTVDGNHPLAGQPLFFAVEIVSVRDASEEEITHGHVHGEGGHHH
jgi:FKBP-type peptidyl-prolyl cis-trans isomerase SlyD